MGTLFRPQVILIAVIAAFAALGGSPALAQSEDTITATVTAQIIAVHVDDGNVNYGALALGATSNTIDDTDAAADQQRIFNDSPITVDLFVSSSNAIDTDPTPTDIDWGLVLCSSSPGTDEFGHQFEVNDINNTFVGTDFPADNSNVDTAVNLIADDSADGTGNDEATLDLGICMPSSANDPSPHSITVTVLVTEQ